MTYETAWSVYQELQQNCGGEVATELKADLVAAAVRYARHRTDWKLAGAERAT